ncbi:coniferyl aldehyde dehydrogenase, partial [Mycobacterium sp.]|uniref:coniferyl aldehyde dehydrogenase n=1 Tax=Mycobacterium sp. TaxID=1785 RepID=UPI003C708DD6
TEVSLRECTADDIAEAHRVQREAFLRDGPPSLAVRRNRMDRLSALTYEHREAIVEAIRLDFGHRPVEISTLWDVVAALSDFAHIRRNLGKWMKARPVMSAARPLGLRTRVQAQPLGVVGIMAPWNLPVHLLICPATAALAAGNRVLLKPSELTPRTAALLEKLAAQYFSPEELAVVTGGPQTSAAFCSMPWDHLLFTGSPEVGKHVQRAAADHLVPITLELGGKNPVVVGRDADIATAASRTARARLWNGGQTCLCPDLVFVPAERCDDFIAAVEQQFRRSYPTILDNPEHCTIVNDKNYQRILGLIDDARAKGATVIEAAPPGEDLPSAAQRRIAPTILRDVTDDMAVMRQEVFGPVLSVLPYKQLDEVIDYLNARPSPLASYWFGEDSADFRRYCAHTRNGGITRNDCVVHAAMDGAPFGGVGNSGMGAHHGKAGFDTFSHYRTITESRLRGSLMGLIVPPVSPRVGAAIDWVTRKQAARLRKRIDRFAESHAGAGQPRVTTTKKTESNGRGPDSRDRQQGNGTPAAIG